jgi:hypothetical protein
MENLNNCWFIARLVFFRVLSLRIFSIFESINFKGSTRAFPPHHPLIPVDYQLTGQPVLVGGTMGTCSYVLTGTEQGMSETFGSTCHGAVS